MTLRDARAPRLAPCAPRGACLQHAWGRGGAIRGARMPLARLRRPGYGTPFGSGGSAAAGGTGFEPIRWNSVKKTVRWTVFRNSLEGFSPRGRASAQRTRESHHLHQNFQRRSYERRFFRLRRNGAASRLPSATGGHDLPSGAQRQLLGRGSNLRGVILLAQWTRAAFSAPCMTSPAWAAFSFRGYADLRPSSGHGGAGALTGDAAGLSPPQGAAAADARAPRLLCRPLLPGRSEAPPFRTPLDLRKGRGAPLLACLRKRESFCARSGGRRLPAVVHFVRSLQASKPVSAPSRRCAARVPDARSLTERGVFQSPSARPVAANRCARRRA